MVTTAVAVCATAAWGQDLPTPSQAAAPPAAQRQTQKPRSVPAGFENVDQALTTVFDVYYDGRRVGVASGTFSGNVFRFGDPSTVAGLLAGGQTDAIATFLSEPLPSNEALRCLPGQTIDCGVLLNGVSGVIVDPDSFRVDIFLGRELLQARRARRLGEPISGPSLIQGFSGSISSGSASEQTVRIGVTLDTIASLGRTSAVSRIFGDNEQGLQVDEAFAQRYAGEHRFAAGLFNTQGALALSTLRVAGAQTSSFYGDYLEQDALSAASVDVVLPRPARVEIYRDGVLVSTSQYGGGLQSLDISRLPTGSYPIRVVARDASGVVLDEIRSFTRAGDLPPPGKFVYSASVGTRMSDNFGSLLDSDLDPPFFPESTGEFVVAATVSRRVGRAVAVGAGFTMVDADFYPEVSTQVYHGQFRGFASAAVGPGGQYAGVIGGSASFGSINTALTARVAEALPLPADAVERLRVYRPFLRDERSVNFNVQIPLAVGAVGVRASYGEFDGLPERYAVGVNYNRPIELRRIGTGLLGMEALYSDNEVRVGVRFTLVRGRSSRGSLSFAGGAEYIRTDEIGGRDGLYPVAQVGYTRTLDIADSEVSVSALGGVSNGDVGVQASAQANSRLGEADISVGAIQTHLADDVETFLTGNIRTGFVYGGGRFYVGGGGLGEAAVIAEITDDSPTRAAADGRFRVVVDDIPYDVIRPGQGAVIPLAAFTEPAVALAPDAAPPFELDLSARSAPLYPGNVVVMTWDAKRVVTVYGRILGPDGQPRVGAYVNAGSDIAITGDGGYFSITGPIGGEIGVRSADGSLSCPSVGVLPAPSNDKGRAVVNIGSLTCSALPPAGP